MRRIGDVDLLALSEIAGLARVRGDLPANTPRDRSTFRFLTIENVAAVVADDDVVGNDSNLPVSAGRHFPQADAHRMTRLRVPGFLCAR